MNDVAQVAELVGLDNSHAQLDERLWLFSRW